MPLLTEAGLRARAIIPLAKSARTVLEEATRAYRPSGYDIFLSHRYADATAILGLKQTLEAAGYSVYIDWIEDPDQDRSRVTAATVDLLRSRMKSSRALFFAVSSTSENSLWMPWELGFVDGKTGKAAVVPIVQGSQSLFPGQEYLSAYPFVDEYEGKLYVNNLREVPLGLQQLTAWLPVQP